MAACATHLPQPHASLASLHTPGRGSLPWVACRHGPGAVATLRVWLQAQGRLNVSVNIFALDSTPFHKEKIAYMKSRGPGCFDAAYYAAQSHDLQQSVGSFRPDHAVHQPGAAPAAAPHMHYVHSGQHHQLRTGCPATRASFLDSAGCERACCLGALL